MPMPPKIVGTKEDLARELSGKNINLAQASKLLDVSRETYKLWLKKNNLPIPCKESIHKDKILKFKSICKDAINDNQKIKLNETLSQLNLHPDLAQVIIKKNPYLRQAIRSKSEAAIEDKTISLDEAQKRLPNQLDRVIGFNNGKYIIQAEDGFIYSKKSCKLRQGDPRGKSGYPNPLSDIKKALDKIGYSLIEDSYGRKKDSIKAIHRDCGIVRVNRFDNFFNQQCPVCSNNGVSEAEIEVNREVQGLGFHTEKVRFIGKTKGKEIDIAIPSKMVGIEYCGLYWHSEARKQESDVHFDKMKQAESEGWRLITIFEDEWKNRKEQVLDFIKSVLGVFDSKIGARKCIIKEISKQDSKVFLDKYHIQGSSRSILVSFGLFYDGILVGVITAGRHHRGAEGLVLNRLCFKGGWQIMGGASRLFSSLVSWAKHKGYSKIISWSDNRYSQGNVYEKMGFTLEEDLSPDYSYIGGGIRKSKQSLRKTPEERLLGITERELRLNDGWYRIWDCGKKRWAFEV